MFEPRQIRVERESKGKGSWRSLERGCGGWSVVKVRTYRLHTLHKNELMHAPWWIQVVKVQFSSVQVGSGSMGGQGQQRWDI